jgi:hypothetical protein
VEFAGISGITGLSQRGETYDGELFGVKMREINGL